MHGKEFFPTEAGLPRVDKAPLSKREISAKVHGAASRAAQAQDGRFPVPGPRPGSGGSLVPPVLGERRMRARRLGDM